MELGEKIRAARLEQGLSQRQLCGDRITRNMLSQIENGSARPSMDTLAYLAERLGKSVSFFLERDAVTSPNMACMEAARQLWRAGDSRGALEALEQFRQPDELFEEERRLLLILCSIREARQALERQQLPYAAAVLERLDGISCAYMTPPLQRELILLRGMAGERVEPGSICDEEALLLRAALAEDPARKLELLAACEERNTPRWHFLAAEARFSLKDYRRAAEHYRGAEEAFPAQVYPRLEQCCLELGDYKGAYEYACRQR